MATLALCVLVFLSAPARAVELEPVAEFGTCGLGSQGCFIFSFPLTYTVPIQAEEVACDGAQPGSLMTLVSYSLASLGPTEIIYPDGEREPVTQSTITVNPLTQDSLLTICSEPHNYWRAGLQCIRIVGSAVIHCEIPYLCVIPMGCPLGNSIFGWNFNGGWTFGDCSVYHPLEWDSVVTFDVTQCIPVDQGLVTDIPYVKPPMDEPEYPFRGPIDIGLPDGGLVDPGGDPLHDPTWTIGSAESGTDLATIRGTSLSLYALAPGDYTVRLNAIDRVGVPTTLQSSVFHVAELSPIASAAVSPSSAMVGAEIALDGSASHHPNANRRIVRWEWDLDGDGGYDVTGKTAVISFATAGSHPVRLRVTDDNVPPKTAEATLDIVITSPPQVTCPADSTLTCAPPGGLSVELAAGVTDAGAGENVTVTLRLGDTVLDSQTVTSPANERLVTFKPVMFLPGLHALSVDVSDGFDSASCDTRVTVVQDVEPPTITCPQSITQCVDPTDCSAVVRFQATASDNCDAGPEIVCSPESGFAFPIGTTTVTCTATDVAGLQSACTFPVTANVCGKCPLGQGYWKNDPTAWPVDALTLGSSTYTKAQLMSILQTAIGTGKNADASLILADQLIAAKLSVYSGTAPCPISAAIAAADGLIGGRTIPAKITPNTAEGKQMTALASTLETFNNGAWLPGCTP